MKKLIIRLGLLMALPLAGLQMNAAVPAYDAAAAKANAQADFANWMKYLPDDVFVAHVSIPGTHDTATAEGWNSSTGPTYSTTQDKTIDEQLAGGIRAFDFRPGMVSGELWCNHGTDQTKLKLADGFKKLTNYLDAHPSEFFVIHIFRGNIFRSGEGGASVSILGGKNDEASQKQYNELFNQLFNQGWLNDYIIEYSPYLKVKDIRGKMVIFRRDRIDFAHIHKAGNLNNWPGDADAWTADQKTAVVLDSDPSVKGVMRVTDVSSPDNATELQTELNSIKGLFEWQCNQTLPNDAKRNGSYKPDWSIIFTSGAYGGENTSGYKKNAAETNPYFTNLIKTAAKKGPTGIVLSDWVLTDNYSAQGVALVPAIIDNNFDYISDYILDDILFAKPDAEKYWEDGKEYFLRNVGTGEFLSVGATWGTRAAMSSNEGLPVKLKFNEDDGTYYIQTSLNSNGMGYDGAGYYMDYGNLEPFEAKRISSGKFNFILTAWKGENDQTLALGVQSVDVDWVTNWSESYKLEYTDGTKNVAHPLSYDPEDPMQQWEIISVEDYFENETKKASKNNPVNISYMVDGHKVIPGDTKNWTGQTSSYTSWGAKVYSYINYSGKDSKQEKNLLIHFTHTTYSTSGQKSGTKWSMKHSIPVQKEGAYKLRFKTGYDKINTSNNEFVFKINNEDIRSKLKDVGTNDPASVIDKFKSNEYTLEFDYLFDQPGEIVFDMSYEGGKTITSVFLDDIELIYYGPIYPILERAIKDAKRRLGETPDWLATYENNMNNLVYDRADEGAAPALEIYQKMRELTLAQTPDDSKHQDYTNAFINAGFETGTLMGWETSYTGEGHDTGVKPNEGVYVTQGGQNTFLFNCWQEDPNPDNRGRGVILSQTIPGLPAGHYMVTAQAANDEGDCMYIEVNGQRSDALVVEYANNVSKLISFEFEVAENTEEVTISFMGGNSDGSFDDYGGNWYKVDDIHLYRSGSADYCVFYRRLLAAMERMNVLAAKTLPQYYQDKWDAEDYHKYVAELIQNHIDSDHSDGDLNGSNGLAERTELFNAFSAVVLSQAETKANMSGAIRNNSFELGDLSYWNTKASPIAMANVTDSKEDQYNISGRDEKHIYYANLHDYEDYNGEAYPIYQTVTGLPKGQYRLSVSVASNAGNTFYLAANNDSKKITATGEGAFQTEEIEFEITADNSDLTLGLYPSADGNFTSQEANAEVKGPWFAVDNFQLWLIGRQVSIDWTMETPTHGTIILPFAVSEENLDAELELYNLTAQVESKAQGATHHVLQLSETPQRFIEANTPYVVKVRNAEQELSTKAVKVAGKREVAQATGKTYTFSGFTENEKMNYTDTYTNGNLTGVLVETKVADDQYHLQSYEDNVGFVLHSDGVDDGAEHETVAPYHAYITIPEEAQGEENIHGLYFEEPTLPLDWYMEGQYYGTIILPFEAEVPEDMNAYTVAGIKDEDKKAMPGVENAYYHLLTIEPVEEVNGVRTFKANVPYLVVMKSAEETQTPEVETPAEPLSLKVAIREAETDAPTATFRGQATNTNASDKYGLLTGVHVDTALADDDQLHMIAEDEKTGAFMSMKGSQAGQIDAHHAYISSADLPEDHGEYLLLAEPKTDEPTSVEEILANSEPVDIYTPAGVVVRRQVVAAEALRELAPGIYIISNDKASVKIIKR